MFFCKIVSFEILTFVFFEFHCNKKETEAAYQVTGSTQVVTPVPFLEPEKCEGGPCTVGRKGENIC